MTDTYDVVIVGYGPLLNTGNGVSGAAGVGAGYWSVHHLLPRRSLTARSASNSGASQRRPDHHRDIGGASRRGRSSPFSVGKSARNA